MKILKTPATGAALLAALVVLGSASCSSFLRRTAIELDPPDKGVVPMRTELGSGGFAYGYWFPRSKRHERLLVYLCGSGSISVLGVKSGKEWKRVGEFWFAAKKFDKDFDILFPDKANLEPYADGSRDRAFLRSYTLDGRVEAAVAVIEAFASAHPYPEIYLLGGSEGGTITARVYLGLRDEVPLRKVAIISGNSLPQAEEFEILSKRSDPKMDPGYRAGLESLAAEYPKILADPESIEKRWFGHSYRRWSSFLPYRALDDQLLIDVPLFAYHGRRDWSTPVEGSRALKAAFDAAGKTNLSYLEDDGDHSGFTKRLKDLADWLKR